MSVLYKDDAYVSENWENYDIIAKEIRLGEAVKESHIIK